MQASTMSPIVKIRYMMFNAIGVVKEYFCFFLICIMMCDMYFRKTAANKNRNVCRGNVDGERLFLQIPHPRTPSRLIHSR